jgi:hypothetical protein
MSEEAAKTVADAIRDKAAELIDAPQQVVQPLVDYGRLCQHLVMKLKTSMGAGRLIILFFEIVTTCASGLLDLFSAIAEVIRRCIELLRTLVREGNITCIDTDTDDAFMDPYGIYIDIPYIFQWGPVGPTDDCDIWLAAQAINIGIGLLGVPESHTGAQDGWDYGNRFV